MDYIVAFLLAAMLHPFFGSVDVTNELDGYVSYFLGLCIMSCVLLLDSPVVAQSVSDGISGISERFMAAAMSNENSSGGSEESEHHSQSDRLEVLAQEGDEQDEQLSNHGSGSHYVLSRDSDYYDGYYDDDYTASESSEVADPPCVNHFDDEEVPASSHGTENTGSFASDSVRDYLQALPRYPVLLAFMKSFPEQRSDSTSSSDNVSVESSVVDRNHLNEEVSASFLRTENFGSSASNSGHGFVQSLSAINALLAQMNALAAQREEDSTSSYERHSTTSSVHSYEWFCGNEDAGYPVYSTTLGGGTSYIADISDCEEGFSEAFAEDDLDIVAQGGNEVDDQPSGNVSGSNEMRPYDSDYNDGYYDDDYTLPSSSDGVLSSTSHQNRMDEGEVDASSQSIESPSSCLSSHGSLRFNRNATFTVCSPDVTSESETGCPREECMSSHSDLSLIRASCWRGMHAVERATPSEDSSVDQIDNTGFEWGPDFY